jgi:hypothetical protein
VQPFAFCVPPIMTSHADANYMESRDIMVGESRMSDALYRALKSAGVEDQLAHEAAQSVVTAEGAEALATKSDVAEWRAATKAEIAESRAATKTEIAELRAATKTDIAEVRIAIADLRSELLKWNTGAMAMLTVIYSAINAALRLVRP